MRRRCSQDACLAKAGGRSVQLDLPLVTVLMNPRQEWFMLATGDRKIRLARVIDIDWTKFNQDNYLFSHATAIASVALEDNDYYIKPACSELVNSNGNGWANEVALATFHSFIGADNFYEHNQNPSSSKGKIVDAIARPVRYRDAKGREADIYYIDVLIATDRKHEDIVPRIIAGELNKVSMGCLCDYVTCSKCGGVFGDNDQNCSHLSFELLQPFVGDDGEEHIVAEMCGRVVREGGKRTGDAKSLRFNDLSWVENPAFYGAVLNHFIEGVPIVATKVLGYSNNKLAETIDDLFRARVADKTGMMVLRLAREEVMRRRREAIVTKVVRAVSRTKKIFTDGVPTPTNEQC